MKVGLVSSQEQHIVDATGNPGKIMHGMVVGHQQSCLCKHHKTCLDGARFQSRLQVPHTSSDPESG